MNYEMPYNQSSSAGKNRGKLAEASLKDPGLVSLTTEMHKVFKDEIWSYEFPEVFY